ncbi:hypothetical protein [Roseococcus thiosulfatophilus]|uniref:hypothetical protein n=1 Tax=Roseococcus thiosulfatophilus TaxID=35813 RepID=UPI001A90BE26|nr:hypothetical protein [Roseococcus thiosulfatophilus]
MLANKLLNRSRDLRELADKGQPLSPDACRLLAEILLDLGERVAVIEALPAPPGPPPAARCAGCGMSAPGEGRKRGRKPTPPRPMTSLEECIQAAAMGQQVERLQADLARLRAVPDGIRITVCHGCPAAEAEATGHAIMRMDRDDLELVLNLRISELIGQLSAMGVIVQPVEGGADAAPR